MENRLTDRFVEEGFSQGITDELSMAQADHRNIYTRSVQRPNIGSGGRPATGRLKHVTVKKPIHRFLAVGTCANTELSNFVDYQTTRPKCQPKEYSAVNRRAIINETFRDTIGKIAKNASAVPHYLLLPRPNLFEPETGRFIAHSRHAVTARRDHGSATLRPHGFSVPTTNQNVRRKGCHRSDCEL